MMRSVTYHRERCFTTRTLEPQDDHFAVARRMQLSILDLVKNGGHAFVLDGFRMECDMVPEIRNGQEVWLRRIRMSAEVWWEIDPDHLVTLSQLKTGQQNVNMVVMEPITLESM